MIELTIKIEVKLLGVLQKLAGKDKFSLEFDSSTIIEDVIFRLADSMPLEFKKALIDPELNDPRPNVLVLLNNTEISVLNGLKTRAGDGDRVVLIPVSHGG